jgi:hypothetical protein
MSLDTIAPLDGLRVSLNLVTGDAVAATYECSFLWTVKHDATPAAQTATARAKVLVEPPNVEFHDVTNAPEDALTFARGLLRTLARSIDETTRWPRRITRWRDK